MSRHERHRGCGSMTVVPVIPAEPWPTPLIAEHIPVEIVLRLAHLICGPDKEPTPEEQALDVAIFEMLAMDIEHRNAHFLEVPWPLRLEIVRLTGQGEGLRHPRPPRPEVQ